MYWGIIYCTIPIEDLLGVLCYLELCEFENDEEDAEQYDYIFFN